MKTVFVLFDSLNRNALGAYGSGAIKTPNFDRFARKAVTFDDHYVGSLPCMPARRDMHTGRLNFMHRSWGPLEPFDNSFPKILSENGIYSHIVSDHMHYFEDGGAGYTNAFDTWEFVRGQENDPWRAIVNPEVDRYREAFDPKHYKFDVEPGKATRENMPRWSWKKLRHAVNRDFQSEESDYPTVKCFDHALEFLDRNGASDNWFLQIEAFDPHEPFTVPQRFKDIYPTGWNGRTLDWPVYQRVNDTPEEIAEIRSNYAALVSMCDDQFGRLLDMFDEQDLWKDTCLIVSTDHGLLLGEHDWWGKNRMPYYTELSNIPLMVWHPDHAAKAGEHRAALTQTTDLMPTILDIYGIAVPEEVTAHSILPLLDGEAPADDIRIFGMYGGPIGATDGRYLYLRYPNNIYGDGLYEYTLMPNHMNGPFTLDELRGATLAEPFDFTKMLSTLKIPADRKAVRPEALTAEFEGCGRSELYDLVNDPGQTQALEDAAVERRMVAGIIRQLKRHDAPEEFYGHFGLTRAKLQAGHAAFQTREG